MKSPTRKPPPTPEEAWAIYEEAMKGVAETVAMMERHIDVINAMIGRVDAVMTEALPKPRKRKRDF
jgi:hypothetical protein